MCFFRNFSIINTYFFKKASLVTFLLLKYSECVDSVRLYLGLCFINHSHLSCPQLPQPDPFWFAVLHGWLQIRNDISECKENLVNFGFLRMFWIRRAVNTPFNGWCSIWFLDLEKKQDRCESSTFCRFKFWTHLIFTCFLLL